VFRPFDRFSRVASTGTIANLAVVVVVVAAVVAAFHSQTILGKWDKNAFEIPFVVVRPFHGQSPTIGCAVPHTATASACLGILPTVLGREKMKSGHGTVSEIGIRRTGKCKYE
jgi:hypothetical protein